MLRVPYGFFREIQEIHQSGARCGLQQGTDMAAAGDREVCGQTRHLRGLGKRLNPRLQFKPWLGLGVLSRAYCKDNCKDTGPTF